MKILMIVESLRDGGKQRRLVELLKALSQKAGYDISVLILKNNIHYREVLEFPGVKVEYLKRIFRRDPRLFLSFYKEAKRINPDVVHAWGGLPAVVALPYVLLSRKPFVNSMIANSRLRFFSGSWFRSRLSFPFSDVIISNSDIGLKVYKAPPDKGRVIRNGVDFGRAGGLAAPQLVRDQYKVGNDKKIVGMVATIDWRKNFPMYIRAALALLAKRGDVVFFVVGDGKDKESLQQMIPQRLKEAFVFTGKIRNVEEVVNVFDVAVLASFGEGTSNSLLEYMLLEKPVVATDVLGINEVLSDNVNGFLVPQNDYLAMMAKFNELLNDANLRTTLGAAGRKLVEENYSIGGMVSGYESVYKEVADQ